MELGACVRLLEKWHPLGYHRMQQEKTKVTRFANVTGRSDWKTFSLASTCHFNHLACLRTRRLSILCSFFFVKHDDQHKGNLWQPPNSSFWLLALSSVVARSLVLGLLFTCCDLLCPLDDACLTQVDRLKKYRTLSW